MNLNPKAKRILCFGDSNTWGANPITDDRFELKERWTGILQKLLGNNYEVIEEGYGGRTTDLNDPSDVYRNGYTYFLPCISSHLPLDCIIITLGTNDLKVKFNRTAEEISLGIERLIKTIKPRCDEYELSLPKIIIVSPAFVNENVVTKRYNDFEGSEKKSQDLGKFYKEVAERNDCEFIDLSHHIKSSEIDGVHLDKDSHEKIAHLMFVIICK